MCLLGFLYLQEEEYIRWGRGDYLRLSVDRGEGEAPRAHTPSSANLWMCKQVPLSGIGGERLKVRQAMSAQPSPPQSSGSQGELFQKPEQL